MTPIIHPEIQRLTEANTGLRATLALLLTEAHDLVHTLRPNLLALYQTKLGAWELEHLKAQFRVARLKRLIELVQADLNRGGKPDIRQIEAQVQEEQVLWEKKIQEAAANLQQAEQRLAHLLPVAQSAELKKLYHQLVKQLHPDLHPDQPAGDRLLWHQVRDAYEAGDLEKLRALALLLRDSPPPAETGPDALEKLQTEHALLEQRIAGQEARLREIESQPPFTLREDLENEAWIAMKRTTLETGTEALQARAAVLEKLLETLVPPHVPGIEFGPN